MSSVSLRKTNAPSSSIHSVAGSPKDMPHADFTAWVAPDAIADAIAHICSSKTNDWRETVLKIYGRA